MSTKTSMMVLRLMTLMMVQENVCCHLHALFPFTQSPSKSLTYSLCLYLTFRSIWLFFWFSGWYIHIYSSCLCYKVWIFIFLMGQEVWEHSHRSELIISTHFMIIFCNFTSHTNAIASIDATFWSTNPNNIKLYSSKSVSRHHHHHHHLLQFFSLLQCFVCQ